MKGGVITVLLAEDSEDDVLFFQRALSKVPARPQLMVASDGGEAIDYLCGKGKFADRARYPFPKMLILDLKMPKVSGLDVLKWLDQHPDYSVMPTIVFSSSAFPADIRSAYRFRASSFFQKPGSLPELVDQVEAIFRYWSRCTLPPRQAQEKCGGTFLDRELLRPWPSSGIDFPRAVGVYPAG